MLYPKIEIFETGKGSKPLAWIYSVRGRLSQVLAQVLPEPQASLAQGIVLGIRSNIPPSLKNSFARTGTAHILAISGLNLTILAGVLLGIGVWLFGRRHHIYVWLPLVTIWLYALLTGMNAPVVRGAIMASLFLIAELLGRQRSAITALAFAAAIMVGISPRVLRDASFQLSFLAMAGLVFIFPPLQAAGRRAVNATVGEGRPAAVASMVTDSFSVTLAAIIATWPVIAYYFGIISFAGPFATFLALPSLPGMIITGALAGILGLVALPVAQVIGWLAWLFLSYFLLVVNGFAALPVSSVEIGSAGATLVWVYYPILVVVLWLIRHRKKLAEVMPQAAIRLKSGVDKVFDTTSRLPRKWVVAPLFLVAILVSFTAVTLPDNRLHVSFLDVGQGDAILVQTPAHQDILIDGGPSLEAISLALSHKMPFWDRTIDLLVLTHPHKDHITGLVEVLHRYRVKQVIYPDLDYASPIWDEWLRVIKEDDIKCTVAQAGQQIDLGEGVVMKVVSPRLPLLTGTESDIDNNSVVLELSMGNISFLLAGDICRETEFELINHRAIRQSTVLKVAHHGSETSTTNEFLAVTSPRLAVISVGEGNSFGHPSKEVVSRLQKEPGPENVYRTDENGTIEFITDGERVWINSDR